MHIKRFFFFFKDNRLPLIITFYHFYNYFLSFIRQQETLPIEVLLKEIFKLIK